MRSSLPNLPAGPDACAPSARAVISVGPALLAGLQSPPRALEEGRQPTPLPGGGRVPCSRQPPGPPGRAWRDQVRALPQPPPPPPGSPRHPGPREVDRPWTAGKAARCKEPFLVNNRAVNLRLAVSSKRLSEIQQETGRDGRRWDEPRECRSEEGGRGQGSFPSSPRPGLILMGCGIDFFFF